MFLKSIAVFTFSVLLGISSLGAQQMQMMPAPGETEDEVVATVEGEGIHMSQLQEAAQTRQLTMQMMQINPQFAQFLQSRPGQEAMDDYKAFVLDNLIDETLLAQEAGREGIEVSQEEIDREFEEHLQQIKSQHGLTDEELSEALQQQGISSMDEYKQMFIEESNLQEQKLLEEAGVGEAEVEQYVQQLREEAEVEIKADF